MTATMAMPQAARSRREMVVRGGGATTALDSAGADALEAGASAEATAGGALVAPGWLATAAVVALTLTACGAYVPARDGLAGASSLGVSGPGELKSGCVSVRGGAGTAGRAP